MQKENSIKNQNNQENPYWKLVGDKIVVKNKKFPILYVSLLGSIVKYLSIAFLALSVFRSLMTFDVPSIISTFLSSITLILGILTSKISKKANNMYLDAVQKESEEKFRLKCESIKNLD